MVMLVGMGLFSLWNHLCMQEGLHTAKIKDGCIFIAEWNACLTLLCYQCNLTPLSVESGVIIRKAGFPVTGTSMLTLDKVATLQNVPLLHISSERTHPCKP